MSEIDLNKIKTSEINENYEGEKDSLIDEIKKANFFVDYFKRKWDEKYNEVIWLYDKLNQEIEKSILDNKIETVKDLAELKKWIEQKSEIEKINEIFYQIEKIADKKTAISPETLKILKSDKLDSDEKQKIFYEIRGNIDLITYIQDWDLIKDFFEFLSWKDIGIYYKLINPIIKYNPDVINSYIKNTSQIDLNLIPTLYFTFSIEWTDNTSFITNQILKWNQSKIESRIRSLFLRLDWYDWEITKILEILLKNENTKNIIEKNLPLNLRNNKNIITFLKENWLEIKNDIEKNPKNKFQELANKVINTNSNDENYNKYIDELDSFTNINWVLDKDLFKEILRNIGGTIERFSCINFNKEIAAEAVKYSPVVFLNLSAELRKDEDIIKSTFKNKSYLWVAYFINIDSPEVLANSYNLLLKLWIEKKDILRLANFKNWFDIFAHEWNILGYKMKWNLKTSNTLKEIHDYLKNDESFLKWWNLILNEISKVRFEKIILEWTKNESKTKEFLKILYWNNNETFSIDSFRFNYTKLLETCSWDEKLLKTIFNNLIDKQAENIEETISILTNNSDLNTDKIKLILKEKTNLSKFIQINIEDKKEKINLDNDLLITDFKEFSAKYPSISKPEVINLYLNEILLGSELSYDEWKLREIISSIISLNYEKIKFDTISKNKELAYNYASWKISKEEYYNVFNNEYNKNLEKNWLSNWNNNIDNKNNIINNDTINLENNNYDKVSWTIFINSEDGKDKITLTNKEKQLVENNPETIEKIVDFYLTLKELWLSELWKEKENIFTSISNKYWIGFDTKSNYLSENETKVFLNSILKSIWQEKIDNTKSLTEFKNIFANQKNDKQIIWNTFSNDIMKKWSSKISEQFLQKYVIWKTFFDINWFSNNI